jgi:hypothetical protein
MLNRQVVGGVILLIAFCGSKTASQQIARTPSGCPASELVRAEPPRDPNADPFGVGPWYINADRSMWAGWDAAHLVSGAKGNKVLWIRPQGTDLTVTGHRLDDNRAAPPLKADIPCCYPTGFQASRVYFPASGCWVVTAKAGRSELTFVTKVS